MNTQEQLALDEQTFGALGRFVVKFSVVLWALENATVLLIGMDGHSFLLSGKRMLLLQGALTDRTASPIVSTFFSVLHERWAGALTEGDKQIMKCLRRELEALVQLRNRLMHDAWASTSVGDDPEPNPFSLLRVRSHGTGVEYKSAHYLPTEIEGLSADAERLAEIVRMCVSYYREGQTGPELEQRFEVSGKKVIRRERTAV